MTRYDIIKGIKPILKPFRTDKEIKHFNPDKVLKAREKTNMEIDIILEDNWCKRSMLKIKYFLKYGIHD